MNLTYKLRSHGIGKNYAIAEKIFIAVNSERRPYKGAGSLVLQKWRPIPRHI